MKTLVLALGNPLRSDDGAGPAVARRLAERNLPGVRILTVHQLTPELIEEVDGAQRVVLVDAAFTGDPVVLTPLPLHDSAPFPDKGAGLSHAMTPGDFVRLADALRPGRRVYALCRVRGERFDVGADLSPAVRDRAEEAARLLEGWVRVPS